MDEKASKTSLWKLSQQQPDILCPVELCLQASIVIISATRLTSLEHVLDWGKSALHATNHFAPQQKPTASATHQLELET